MQDPSLRFLPFLITFFLQVFYTADEVRSLRTLDLEPGIKLLGFKDRSELAFEDNVRHSFFIYPDEGAYAGSRRTFAALLSSMMKKGKIGLARVLTRRNASPSFCALLPQEGEGESESEGWTEPSGFHLIPLPFADDIRAAPIEEGFQGGLHHTLPHQDVSWLSMVWTPAEKELVNAAKSFISKLALRNGTYPPDSYPNPGRSYPLIGRRITSIRIDSIGLPLRAAGSDCIPRGVPSSFVRRSHSTEERDDPQKSWIVDQRVDEAFTK
jgi:Ku70/Ku80 beta-barrel domain